MRISPARNLAVAAVGAMAVTGLATVAAPTAAHAADAGVVLVSQYNPGHDATVRYEGTDSAITVAALKLDPAAAIGFEVNLDPDATDTSGGWTPIDGSRSTSGDLETLRWNGDNYRGVSLLGRTVALRAVAGADDGAGDTVYTYSRQNRVRLDDDGSQHSVHVIPASSGFFAQPYADTDHTRTFTTAHGNTSASDGTVAMSWRGQGGSFHGSTDATVAPTSFKAPYSYGFVPGGTFAATLDITEYGAQDGDVLAVGGSRDTDDVAPISLYQQTINGIAVHSTPGYARAGQEAPVQLGVTDTAGRPVTGTEVRRGSDGALVGYTGSDGIVTARQPVGTDTYYVNATDADSYLDTDGDFTTGDVTIEEYEPTPGSSSLVSADGTVFDDDEYAGGDLGIRYVDQYGNPMPAGTDVVYRVYGIGEDVPATLTQTTTGGDGVAPIDFDPAATQDGDVVVEWRLGTETDPTVGDPVDAAGFTAGQAVLTLAPGDDGAIGGAIDYVGSLSVEDLPLPGRAVSLRYLRGVEVVPGRFADAALVTDAGRRLQQTVVTNGNGVFRATVADRDESVVASEVGGRLTAATADNVATDDATLAGDAAETRERTTQFGDGSRGTVRVFLYGRNAARTDVLRVAAPASVSGETVKVFRVVGGREVLERTAVLNGDGDLPYVGIPDRNGVRTTTYVVRLVASTRVLGATSNDRELS